MGRLGGRTEPDLRATCLLEAQYVQETELEGGPILPWFLISEDTVAVMTIEERRLEVPDDFLRELDDEGALVLVKEDGSEQELIKKSYDELVSWHGLTTTADYPENYALVGKYFMLFPLPLKASTVRMRYYARDVVLNDDNTENQWLKWATDLLLAATGYAVASKHIRDDEKAVEFSKDRDKAHGRLVVQHTARDEGNRDRSMG